MTYGHRRKKDCSDIELLLPIGKQDRNVVVRKVDALRAQGETPIAGALDASLAAFAKLKGDHNRVILVTDGAEECHGDPCEATRRLVAAGLDDVKVDTVGFNLPPLEREAVECIAREGHGHYYDARDQVSLIAALTEVRQEVQLTQAAPPPPPSPPAPTGPAKVNLISEANGGGLILAPTAGWDFVAKGNEKEYAYGFDCQGKPEVVFGFKDEKEATFDTFQIFIPHTDPANIKDFELFVGDDGPTGTFRSIGQFTTANARMVKSPYQPFRFPEVTAKYLKVRVLSSWGSCFHLTPWRLLGRPS
jgi:hypothetical protein